VTELLAAGDLIRSHWHCIPVVLVLVIARRFHQNSAQFPFHFWLPHLDGGAHTVIGLSATLRPWFQAGVIFCWARFLPAFIRHRPLWFFPGSSITHDHPLLAGWPCTALVSKGALTFKGLCWPIPTIKAIWV